MKRLMTFIMVCLAVLGLLLLNGCGSIPVYAFDGDEMDVWPCFYGTDNGGPDNGYMVFYDQDVNAFQAPRLIDNDLLDAQWTPQRNGIGWKTDGSYNVSFIEATGNDLEIWESPDDGWQDDAGAWAMTDNDASANWHAVDVETRQNYILALVGSTTVGTAITSFYIDLAAGAPNWINFPPLTTAVDNVHFSLILGSELYGVSHEAVVISGVPYYAYHPRETGAAVVLSAVSAGGEYPQIILDLEQRFWVFHTNSNDLDTSTSLNQPHDTVWGDVPQIYAANTLTSDYHATWLKADDTIHVVLVDFSLVANSTTLRYLRRTANGWSAAIILLTVDSDLAGANDTIAWPQITVDPIGSIFVYFIFDSDFADVGVGGDLQGFHLDFTDNDDFATPATWTRYTNIDASGTNILWCVAPDSVVIASDI